MNVLQCHELLGALESSWISILVTYRHFGTRTSPVGS